MSRLRRSHRAAVSTEIDDSAYQWGVNERMSAIDDVDSEEEAYMQVCPGPDMRESAGSLPPDRHVVRDVRRGRCAHVLLVGQYGAIGE